MVGTSKIIQSLAPYRCHIGSTLCFTVLRKRAISFLKTFALSTCTYLHFQQTLPGLPYHTQQMPDTAEQTSNIEVAAAVDPDFTPQPPANNIQPASDIISRIRRRFSKQKETPAVPAVSRVESSFVSLGKNIFGQPTDIDDRLHVLPEGIKHMSKWGQKLGGVKKFSKVAVSVLHRKQRPRPASDSFLSSAPPPAPHYHTYARVVEARVTQEDLPPAEQVFDKLLKSTDAADHPNGVSSLTFAIASLISLSLSRTNTDSNFNETSPYLDLSPLYGVTEFETNQVRTKDGRGMLYPDCFFEDRLTFLPHSVSALLILWNRNHNYIARRLLLNNEAKKWVDPSTHTLSDDGSLYAPLVTQDDEIFHIARLINCAQFKNVVAEDFLKGLLGLAQVGPNANLDITVDVGKPEMGKGHDSSVEFALLYNCSALMSQSDLERVKETLRTMFGSGPLDKITPDILRENIDDLLSETDPNRRRRNYAGIRRQQGSDFFNDNDLARVLQDATNTLAGKPRSRGTDSCLQVLEMMNIEQARKWEVGTLNGFRRYLGLKPLRTFAEWNSDPAVIAAAEELYGSIENLELYAGLQAEEVMPGSGFCFGYTMTYGMIVDVITTIRSDPNFTTDFTPAKLTQWGHKECFPDPNNGAFGAMLPKLLSRTLPRNYPHSNVYSLFPLTSPKKTIELLEDLKLQDAYDCERPKNYSVRTIATRSTISYVFSDPSKFGTPYQAKLRGVTNGYGYLLGNDNKKHHGKDLLMTFHALVPDRGTLSERYSPYFKGIATSLIKERSLKNNGTTSIDIVRDVINATCTRWVCDILCDYNLPPIDGSKEKRPRALISFAIKKLMKTMPLPDAFRKMLHARFFAFGSYEQASVSKAVDAETEMFEKLAAIYGYIFQSMNPDQGWATQSAALDASDELRAHITAKLMKLIPASRDPTLQEKITAKLDGFWSTVIRFSKEYAAGKHLKQDSGKAFLDRLVKASKDINLDRQLLQHIAGAKESLTEQQERDLELNRLAANALMLSVMSSIDYAKTCAQAVNFYLDDNRAAERADIIKLSVRDDPNDNALIMRYIREAQRISQPRGLYRVAREDTIIPGQNSPVRAGERIYADFHQLHMNGQDFRNPEVVDLHRGTSPFIQGMGLHRCPGFTHILQGGAGPRQEHHTSFVDETMPEVFKAIFRLKGIRRDTGKGGRLVPFQSHPSPTDTDPKLFVEASGEVSHVPKSLVLLYDTVPDVDETAATISAPGAVASKKTRRAKVWAKIRPGNQTITYRRIMDRVMQVLVLCFIFWILRSCFRFMFKPTKRAPRVREEVVVVRQNVECPEPLTTFHPLDTYHLVPGPDDQPIPIEYTLDHVKAHKLTVFDIDARDTRLAVYIDGVPRGQTRDFELNKTMDCGEDLGLCLSMGYSAGVVVVPPGNHTVRIEWAGNDFINGTGDIDWGEQRFRRIKWMREYCA